MHIREGCTNEPITSLAIGVTGHRSDRLTAAALAAIRERVRHVFSAIVEATSAHLTIVSSLADGADQLVAEEAIAAGHGLYCPLPFNVDDFDHEFGNVDDLSRFHALVSRADCVWALGGSRESAQTRDSAYVAAGTEMLARSDMLLAIWDGEHARGTGGTAEVVAGARSSGKAVIWISAHPPHRIEIVDARQTLGTRIVEALSDSKKCSIGHRA